MLSYQTVRRSVVDRKDLKSYWKSEKRPHCIRWSTILLFASFSKTLLTTEKRLTGLLFLAGDFPPTFLNTGTTNETFQQSRKQNSFRHILKNSASLYGSSGSQFFRTTTWFKQPFFKGGIGLTKNPKKGGDGKIAGG